MVKIGQKTDSSSAGQNLNERKFDELDAQEHNKIKDILTMKLRTLQKALALPRKCHPPISLVEETENSYIVKLSIGQGLHIQGTFTRQLVPIIDSFELKESS